MVTVSSVLCRHLEAAGALRVAADEPLARHTTFRIGGPARVFIEAGSEQVLRRILGLFGQEGLPHVILGGGSNVLAPDEGVNAAVVKLTGGLARASVEATRLRAGAGASLGKLAAAARTAGLSGLEFAGTIPGTLGGALVGNAGYGGSCIGDLVESITVLLPSGTPSVLGRDEISFGYRSSSLGGTGVILGATLRLRRGDRETISAAMRDLAASRRARQPLGAASAGCVFKNPPDGRAGRLIEEAGLGGHIEGNAQISEVHANFIVNRGGASAEDVKRLIATVVERVKECSGVSLALELQLLSPDP